MSVNIEMSEPVLVYSPPVNNATKKWGVYCIPRLWRDKSGKLIIRFNGEQDMGDTDNMQCAPNMYFVSEDEGESWIFEENGDEKYSIDILNGIGSPYVRLQNGNILTFREKPDLHMIEDDTFHQKEFVMPNGEALVYSYRYGDIKEESKAFEKSVYNPETGSCEIEDVDIFFDEREVLVNAKGFNGKDYVEVKKFLRQSIWKNAYFSSVTLLPDGTLGALCFGQNPNVEKHYSGAVYFITSSDGGKTWTKRGDVAVSETMPNGYGGDGHEASLALCSDGTLFCAMRMDMSINPDLDDGICGCFVSRSTDGGYTWCEPFCVSDSSVTPQVVSLGGNVLALLYGRPGVHMIVSEDSGKTWGKPISIIGKTLDEYRSLGIKDSASKYFDAPSYSNIFCEKLSENSFLVVYNDLKYDEGDGVCHKAGFVRKIYVGSK